MLETVRHLKDIGVEVRFEKEHINSMSGDGDKFPFDLIQSNEKETAVKVL